MLLLVVLITVFSLVSSGAVLADRNLDALSSEAFTDRSALDYTREFLRTEHRELITKYGCQYRAGAVVSLVRVILIYYVDEIEF